MGSSPTTATSSAATIRIISMTLTAVRFSVPGRAVGDAAHEDLDRREHRDEQGRPAPDPESAVGGHRAASSRARTRSAIERQGGRQSLRRALALGHLGPAAATAVDRGRRPRGRGRRREIPRATRSSLTVTKSCGSSASRPSAMTPDAEQRRGASFAAAFRASIESYGPAKATSGRPARPPRRAAASSPGFGSPPARRAAGLEPPLRLAELVLERADPVRRAPRPSGRRPPRPPPRARRRASAR